VEKVIVDDAENLTNLTFCIDHGAETIQGQFSQLVILSSTLKVVRSTSPLLPSLMGVSQEIMVQIHTYAREISEQVHTHSLHGDMDAVVM
jgi:hypothetical protein